MSELLNSLGTGATETKSFAQEVAEAAADYKEPESTPEPRELRVEPPTPEAEFAEVEAENAVLSAPVQEAPQPQEDDRKVSLRALQEERQKRQEMERKLAQLEAWASQMQPQQPQEQFVEPDPETDPIGALKYTKQQLMQMQQAEQARQAETYYKQTYISAAQQFASQVPDFRDAYQYAIRSRGEELAAVGMPPEQINMALQREEMALTAQAMRNGMNPAEAIYKFAKARGYNGPAPAAQPAPAPVPEMQRARQAVSPTPTATGNKPAPAAMTLETLANLKGAAFDKAFEKHFYGNREGSMFRR